MRVLVLFLLIVYWFPVYSQTIFTYGNKAVSKAEFLKAYKKNNTEEKTTDQSYRQYLELFTRFKIKVQAGLDMKLDTLPNQLTELKGFRTQVADNYLNDDASVNALIDEAFQSSRKDIHLAHIFIPLPAKPTAEELKKVEAKINQAYDQLIKGADFGKVALQFSQDSSVKINMGDIGFITAFTLPYELESLAYSTPIGKFSKPYRSKIGFHIFKNLGERKAFGRMHAAQILLTFPPGASDNQKQAIKQTADSIYNALLHGSDFRALAAQFSSDNLSFQNGGEIQEFGIGYYEPAFEAAAFALAKDGDISKPVLTSFGYHIIKRLQQMPVSENKNDKARMDELKQKVLQQSDRMQVSRKLLVKKVLQETQFRKLPMNERNLWVFTDSVLQTKALPKLAGINANTPLFSFARQTIRIKDWQNYLTAIRDYENLRGNKTNEQLMDQYIETTALEYYRDHLEEYNKDFAYQLQEFKEGNLLFEIMQRKIWDLASSDSIGLKKYYESNKNKYWWETSADVLILTCSNDSIATVTKKKLQSDYKNWRSMIETSNGVVQGDSGRFELGQIPVAERTQFTEGLITANVKNEVDNSVTFAYVIKLRPARELRNFEEARGFVINDYQSYLEEKWINELKKKYPIRIYEEVVKSLSK